MFFLVTVILILKMKPWVLLLLLLLLLLLFYYYYYYIISNVLLYSYLVWLEHWLDYILYMSGWWWCWYDDASKASVWSVWRQEDPIREGLFRDRLFRQECVKLWRSHCWLRGRAAGEKMTHCPSREQENPHIGTQPCRPDELRDWPGNPTPNSRSRCTLSAKHRTDSLTAKQAF